MNKDIAYRVSTVAAMMDMSVWTVYRLIAAKKLRAVRYTECGPVVIPADSLDEFRQKHLIPVN